MIDINMENKKTQTIDTLIGFLIGVMFSITTIGIICIANPKSLLTEQQKSFVDKAEQLNENMETFKEYKNICDVIYDSEVDPSGDTFTETDMGAYYLKLRLKTDSIIKKTYCIGEI